MRRNLTGLTLAIGEALGNLDRHEMVVAEVNTAATLRECLFASWYTKDNLKWRAYEEKQWIDDSPNHSKHEQQ